MKTAAIYTRYSTENQTENSTLFQIQACEDFCKKNNLVIYKVFSDEETSGTNTNRPQFKKLIQEAEMHNFNCIVIYDSTRASRDIIDWFEFRKKMKALEIDVLSVHDKIGDMLDPSNFLTELITVGIGQHHVLQSRQKSIDGKITKAKKGLFMGGTPPLGYDIKNERYIINLKEAEAVKIIYSMYSEDFKLSEICKTLNDNGYKTKANKEFKITSLYDILRNVKYIGTFIWNKKNNREMHKWVGRKNPEEKIIKIENLIPIIIEKELFDKVQAKIKNKKTRARKSNKRMYLLSGKIECMHCKRIMYGITKVSGKGIKTISYICPGKIDKLCNAKNIPALILEKEITKEVKKWASRIDVEIFVNDAFNGIKQLESNPDDEKLLEQIELQLKNITNAIKNGLFYPELKEELDNLKNQKDILTQKIAEQNKIVKNAEDFKNRIRNSIINKIKKMSNSTLENMIKEYVKKITPISSSEFQLEIGVVSLEWLPKSEASLTDEIIVKI